MRARIDVRNLLTVGHTLILLKAPSPARCTCAVRWHATHKGTTSRVFAPSLAVGRTTRHDNMQVRSAVTASICSYPSAVCGLRPRSRPVFAGSHDNRTHLRTNRNTASVANIPPPLTIILPFWSKILRVSRPPGAREHSDECKLISLLLKLSESTILDMTTI